MKRLLVGAVVSAFAALLLLPAVAGAVWGATPQFVANQLVSRYRTSDGHALVRVVCIGVKSSAHRRHGRLYFHRFGCGETDDVGRVWGVTVVVHGPNQPLSVTERTCNATNATLPCP